jgi:heme exporter protein C
MGFTGKIAPGVIAQWLENSRRRSAYPPRDFYPLVGLPLPWLAWGAVLACALGLWLGLVVTPPGAQRGDLFPIVFIHVPAAWMSVCLYLLLAFWAGAGLLLRESLFAMVAQALAPTGAMFALMTLWTGSLWGKPTWGSWWDARLATELVLLLLYVTIITCRVAIEDARAADRVVALVALLGAATVPGVLWVTASWRAFHPPPLMPAGSGAATSLVAGLLALFAGFWMYASAVALKRLRCVILERERQSDWVERQSDWLVQRAGGGR